MLVMPSNNSGMEIGRLCGLHPGRIGWLISPEGWRRPPSWLPYALDNGAYGAWANGTPWDEAGFLALLDRAREAHPPLWVVVPDVVMDREATLARWQVWAPRIRETLPRTPLAFAVQDGMTPADVPESAAVVFIGGSTAWKWRHLRTWTRNFPRVHVARVNSERMLWMAHDAGAESCDGTGWMRGGEARLAELARYLAVSDAGGRRQLTLDALL